jgi:hypothetical protein
MYPTPRSFVPRLLIIFLYLPGLAIAQTSPFLTGATALQSNILAWLTPVAIILVMILGGMAMANRLVENCGNTLVLRCSASEGGGTARFASQLIGDREVVRTTISTSRRFNEFAGARTRSEHFGIEAALLPSEIEQLPDLAGYLKLASTPHWRRVALSPPQPTTRKAAAPPLSLRQLAKQQQVPDSLEIE